MNPSVAIIGAGPGGASAAIALAQRGVSRVLLLDKDAFPRDKTCGSGLSPNAVALLSDLGVGGAVRARGYAITGLRLTTPGGRQMVLSSGEEEAAVILLRKDFDDLLVERAKALGVEFQSGFHARSLIEEGGRVVGVKSGEGEVRADHVLCADGAHSIFSRDPRPRRTISTLMGWWEDFDFEPHILEMVFDKSLAPLYGWMFPEGERRVNIGICIDGEEADGFKQSRNVRDVFRRFLDDHYADRLAKAKQVGRLKGHPIAYTTWIDHTSAPGVVFLGEAARITHNATGEGIYQAMQSGVYAADALSRVIHGEASEAEAMRSYAWACRRRFTTSFVIGHAVRALVQTPLLDGIAGLYNSPRVRNAAARALRFALAGSAKSEGTVDEQAAHPIASS
jgi:menaquinone-9 beta-reductase